MSGIIYHWIDVLWLPIAYFYVSKRHRWIAVGFVAACMTIMRIQSELLEYVGLKFGILGLMSFPIYSRLVITYSIFYLFFILIAVYSQGSDLSVFLAACLAIFFMAFFTSSFVIML